MKRFGSESGQTLIFVALSMTLLLGFVGFATDVGVLLHEKREVQTAADAAALAAATEAKNEGNPSSPTASIKQAAKNDAALNGFTDGTNGATVSVLMAPSITQSAFNSAGYVQVTVTQSTPDFFMRLFGTNSTNVSATAIASNLIPTKYCGYIQNQGNANPAVSLGGSSVVFANKCGIAINGNLSLLDGGASFSAAYVDVSGTVSGSISGVLTTNAAPQPNPLPALSNPANEPTASSGSCTSPDGSTCYYDFMGGNLKGPLTLSPGVYYFDEPVSISGAITNNVDSSGSGVMFYVDGSQPFDFAANGTVNLTPINSGIYDDVLVDAPDDGPYTTCSSGKGNNSGQAGELYFDFGSSSTTLNGIVYAPDAELFTQDKGATLAINTSLVVGNICQQSADLTINGITGKSPITKVGLVY